MRSLFSQSSQLWMFAAVCTLSRCYLLLEKKKKNSKKVKQLHRDALVVAYVSPGSWLELKGPAAGPGQQRRDSGSSSSNWKLDGGWRRSLPARSDHKGCSLAFIRQKKGGTANRLTVKTIHWPRNTRFNQRINSDRKRPGSQTRLCKFKIKSSICHIGPYMYVHIHTCI